MHPVRPAPLLSRCVTDWPSGGASLGPQTGAPPVSRSPTPYQTDYFLRQYTLSIILQEAGALQPPLGREFPEPSTPKPTSAPRAACRRAGGRAQRGATDRSCACHLEANWHAPWPYWRRNCRPMYPMDRSSTFRRVWGRFGGLQLGEWIFVRWIGPLERI